MTLLKVSGFLITLLFALDTAVADTVAGLYNAILLHENTEFYQKAKITLRTLNNGGELKVSANVRIYFGDFDSQEFLTYEFGDVPLNLLTRQISMKSDANDVSMTGFLKDSKIEGEWFSTVAGRVGSFKAQKTGMPEIPEGAVLVSTVSGHYRGNLTNTNPSSNLPERISITFVTTQDTTNGEPVIKISGTTRFYLGDFDSLEYIETPFTSVQFNFFNRNLVAKTRDYGITFKGNLTHEGVFDAKVLSDGLGDVGTTIVHRYP